MATGGLAPGLAEFDRIVADLKGSTRLQAQRSVYRATPHWRYSNTSRIVQHFTMHLTWDGRSPQHSRQSPAFAALGSLGLVKTRKPLPRGSSRMLAVKRGSTAPRKRFSMRGFPGRCRRPPTSTGMPSLQEIPIIKSSPPLFANDDRPPRKSVLLVLKGD
jgi:hypothetical protein